MTGRPRLRTRMAAALRGEVAADTVEAYRRAGRVVYGDLARLESLRAELLARRQSVWSAGPAVSAQLLCTWNAYVLQTVAEQLIDADYAADPRTAGYLPEVTAEQVGRLLGQVEGWVSRARQAAGNPGYRLADELALPADLPEWVRVEPCPPTHLTAMTAAGQALREHAQLAVFDLEKADVPADRAADLGRLRQLAAAADTAFQFADRMYQPGAPPQVHEAVEEALHRALETTYHLGQLAAMPDLLAHYRPDSRLAAVATRVPGPGEPDFDPWVLTDPTSRAGWQADPRATRALWYMWRNDPNPRATLAIQAEIDAALHAGDIAPATDRRGRRLGNYFCCPWAPVYQVRRPCTIGGRRLRTMEQFTFDVSAEQLAEGGPFVRQILVSSFTPTEEVDYCDGEDDGH